MKRDVSGKNNPMYGKNHSQKTIEKIKATKKANFFIKFDDRIEKIIRLYKEGNSMHKIALQCNTNNRAVKILLDHNGISIRGQGSIYTVSDDFFTNIDNEKKAYWLGMLAADGTIRKNKNRNEIVLSLKVSDKDHIVSFLSDIGSTSKVYFVNRSGSDQAYASVTSKKLKEDLIKLGIGPNKTGSLVTPTIPNSISRHFWRGYMDGDGCITTSKGKYWIISFIGTLNIVNGFVKFLKENIDGISNCKILHRCNKLYSIKYGSQRDTRLIAKLLYFNSNRHLQRKYELANKIILRESP